MASLYELSEEAKRIDQIIELQGGELDSEIERRLDEIQLNFGKKIESAAMVVRNKKSLALVRRTEAKRLQDSAKSLLAQAARLESYMIYCMRRAKRDRVETTIGTVSVRKSSRVHIDPGVELPEFYLRQPKPMPNKALIKKAIVNGVEVEGCSLIPIQTVQIK